MTVNEFYSNCHCKSELRILSAFDGKVLCYRFNPEKHSEIGKKKILDMWAEIKCVDSCFGNYAKPYLCCYVSKTGGDYED